MNNYQRLFKQISPVESDEQLIAKVLARKAENMKDTNTTKSKGVLLRKAVVIPTAAALALGAATISVGAANNWDYGHTFRNMFAQGYEGNVSVTSEVHGVPSASDSTASTVSKVDYVPERPIGTFDFEKYGKPLGIVLEGDGVTATLDGMLAYDDMCLIMYTLTATDDIIAATGGEVPGLRIDFGNFGFKIDGKVAGGMSAVSEPISEDGNTRTGIIRVTYNSVDLSGKTLNISFISETNDGELLINEKRDIVVDFPIAQNIEKPLDLDLTTDSFNGKISKITIGGFKAKLEFSGELSDADFYDQFKQKCGAVITLADGTTVAANVGAVPSHGIMPAVSGEIELRYTYPLDPADVVSIAFNGQTVTF